MNFEGFRLLPTADVREWLFGTRNYRKITPTSVARKTGVRELHFFDAVKWTNVLAEVGHTIGIGFSELEIIAKSPQPL